jgi:PmbA protein
MSRANRPLPENDRIAEAMLRDAKAAGATAAEVMLVHSRDKQAGIRLGTPETIEQAESRALGLRVFVGRKSASVSTSDFAGVGLKQLAENAVLMAKAAPDDPFTGLADNTLLARNLPELDLYDTKEPEMAELQSLAKRAEEAGRSTPGITNSEGAEASWGQQTMMLMTSHGVHVQTQSSHCSMALSLIAGTGGDMQRDYAYRTRRFFDDLPPPETIGQEAASRTLSRLNPSKIASQSLPVLFEPRVGKQLLGAFASAISGAAIARGTSFLKDTMGQEIFAPGITITDDPLRPRGLASRPCDAEGVAVKKLSLITNGVLKSWFLDTRSANQLGLKTTGHAARSIASAPSPSPSNLYIEAGTTPLIQFLSQDETALYISETFGHGVNLITGDYSQGASGFLLQRGERVGSISEITIAGNLRAMFLALAVADDLAFDYGINVPTIRIERMAIAGS